MTSQEQLDQKIKEIAEKSFPLNPKDEIDKWDNGIAIEAITVALQDKELLSLAIKVQEEKEQKQLFQSYEKECDCENCTVIIHNNIPHCGWCQKTYVGTGNMDITTTLINQVNILQ